MNPTIHYPKLAIRTIEVVIVTKVVYSKVKHLVTNMSRIVIRKEVTMAIIIIIIESY